MKLKTILVITLLFFAKGLYAQSQKTLTLKEALDLAVTNSKELMISKSNVEQAQAKLAQAKAQAWPDVKASATYLAVNTPTITFPGSAAAPDNSGGGTSSPLASLANLHQIMLGQVTVTQPIFAGFKIKNAKVMQSYLAEAAAYDETTTKNKVITNTVRALFQYYELQETKKHIDQHLKQVEQRVTEFKNLESQGLLARNDRLKAELQLNNIELTKTEVNNNLLMASYNLGILLGLPENQAISLDTTGMFDSQLAETWENYQQKGIESRPEIKSAHLQVEAGKANTRMARASRYPSLALTGGYVNAYIPNVVTISNALNGGVGIQYNLSQAFHSKHMVREARATLRRAELTEAIANDNVRLQVRQKFLNLQQAREKIIVSERAIEQATENFNISKNKYTAGLMILSDYLDADVTLLQTQINYATARAESMIAYYELQEATGGIQ